MARVLFSQSFDLVIQNKSKRGEPERGGGGGGGEALGTRLFQVVFRLCFKTSPRAKVFL